MYQETDFATHVSGTSPRRVFVLSTPWGPLYTILHNNATFMLWYYKTHSVQFTPVYMYLKRLPWTEWVLEKVTAGFQFIHFILSLDFFPLFFYVQTVISKSFSF